MAAPRRGAQRARGAHRLRRSRTAHVVVPGVPGGRARGPAAAAQDALPHFQRLHHGAAHGTRLRVLPPRPLLRGPSRRGPPSALAGLAPRMTTAADSTRRDQGLALLTAFLALFSIVGFALYGLPFFYDFFVKELGWTRREVTSGNALSKLVIGPAFGFLAGLAVDRFGPRRLMLFGIVVAGLALVGLSTVTGLAAFY